MRIPCRRRSSGTLDNESMTPMIDVVFLLLIFFVVASIGQKPDALLPATMATGATETEVDIFEPEPDQPPVQEVRIHLQQTAQMQLGIELNERAVTAAELRTRLKTLSDLDPRSRIILDVEDEVLVQQFITIYEYCQTLAFESISFAVHQ
ncbi:MAG: biopolymer transporter ExbD [Planctomycetaceae bacterium]